MVVSDMLHGVDGEQPLSAREARLVEDVARSLAVLPTQAPIADVFEAIRPCLPVAAGLLGILRPNAPASMVTFPVRLDPPVLDAWLSMPEPQRARTLGPIFSSRPGDLWRDSETVTSPLREQLDVFGKLDAAGLGEGAGYKVEEHMSRWHGAEHLMLAFIMERSFAVPRRASVLLGALHPAISAAILRIRLPFLPSEPLREQIVAEREVGYLCVSPSGSVIATNSRAHELVTRFRGPLRVPGGRSVVADFAARARELAGRSTTWRREGDGPRSILQVATHTLARDTHDLREDVVLVVLEEIVLPKSLADELIDAENLAPRMDQIARLLAHTSLVHKEIAAKLSISPRTVDTHADRIYERLGVAGRHALMALAAK